MEQQPSITVEPVTQQQRQPQEVNPMNTHIEKVKQELGRVGVRTSPRDNLFEHCNRNCRTLSLYYTKVDGKPTTGKEGYFGFVVIDPPENENYQIHIMGINPRLWQAKYFREDVGGLFGKWEDCPVWYAQNLADLKAKIKDFVFYSDHPMGKKSTYVHPDTAQNLEGEIPDVCVDCFGDGYSIGKRVFIKSRGTLTVVTIPDNPGLEWLSKNFGVDKNHIKFQSYPEFKKHGGKMKRKRINMFFNRKNRD
jgi:hypothetical protein